MRVLLKDALQDQFSLTSELPRTIQALFTRPGFLTAEYSAGRIARYISPLRLYLAASLIFFVILSTRTNAAARDYAAGQGARSDAAEAVSKPLPPLKPGETVSEGARCQRSYGPGDRTKFCSPWRWLNDRMRPRALALNELPAREADQRMRQFLISRASTVVFLLVPLFALMLKLLYWRTRRFYAEHFVFALHAHAFTFFVLAVILAIPRLSAGEAIYLGVDFAVVRKYLTIGLFAWAAIHLLVSMKRVYGQGWILTLGKFFVLTGSYGMLMILGIMVEIIIAFFMI